MTSCRFTVAGTIDLYFYGELPPPETEGVVAHLRDCAACRQHVEDLRAIRSALADRPRVDAPPTADWSGFTRRLDAAIAPAATGRSARRVMPWLALAATVTIVTSAVAVTSRASRQQPSPPPAAAVPHATPGIEARLTGVSGTVPADRSLVQHSEEHFERSKLVVLGIATLDPRQVHAADWEHERELAGSLLPDTRLYRLAAEDRGMTNLARVLGDLETVLLETSMADHPDRESLERVQRLIAHRDLVVKMNVMGLGI